MSRPWDNPENREKRRAILQKAELEINLVEKEMNEWRLYKKDTPQSVEAESRNNTISDILCKTPTRYSPISDINIGSPSSGAVLKRLKEVEELRKSENKPHRKEIERLEGLIDKLQQDRKNDFKYEILQQSYNELSKELAKKNKEIVELKNLLKHCQKNSKPVQRSNSRRLEKDRRLQSAGYV